MKMKKLNIILFIGVLLLSTNSIAKPREFSDINAARIYKVYYAGLHIADFITQATNNRVEAIIESKGIAKLFSNYSSKTFVTYKYNKAKNDYIPFEFFTESKLKNRERKINITYNDIGNIVTENVTPPDNRTKRPAVENNLKIGALDPLMVAIFARDKIHEAINKQENEFTLKVYDGRRLANLYFTINGKETVKFNNENKPAINVTLKREPVAGFTNNELKRMENEEPTITIYLSDDEMLLPLKANAKAPLGSAVLKLEKECKTLQNCLDSSS